MRLVNYPKWQAVRHQTTKIAGMLNNAVFSSSVNRGVDGHTARIIMDS
jgi:hypothetical protein